MKLTKISIVTLLPIALCITVPEANIRIEKDIGLEGLNSLGLFSELTAEQGLALFFKEAHRVANKAIQSHAEALGIEGGPHNLSELFESIFSNEAISAAQSVNVTGTNPFTSLFDHPKNATTTTSSSLAGGSSMLTTDLFAILFADLGKSANNQISSTAGSPTMFIMDSIAGLAGSLDRLSNITSTTLLTTNTPILTNPLFDLLNGITNGLGGLTNNILGELVNATAGLLGGILGIDMKNGTGGLGTILGGGLNSTNATNTVIEDILNTTKSVLESTLNNTSMDSPFGDYGSVIGGAANNTITTVSDVIDTVSSAVEIIFSDSDGNKYNVPVITSANDLDDMLNDTLNCVVTITDTISNNTTSLENAIGNPFSHTIDLSSPVDSVIEGTTKTSFFISPLVVPALIASLLGQIANNANNSILNANTLKALTEFINGIINSAQNSSVPIVSLIDAITQAMSRMTDSENPLGSFLQDLVAFIFQNQAGILSNIIQFGSFFEPISRAILSLISGITTSFNPHVQDTLHNIILGVIARVLDDGILSFRLQDISAEHLQKTFVDTLGIQNSTEQAFEIVNRMARHALLDPVVSSIVGIPTEDNMARIIVMLAKALSEHVSVSIE